METKTLIRKLNLQKAQQDLLSLVNYMEATGTFTEEEIQKTKNLCLDFGAKALHIIFHGEEIANGSTIKTTTKRKHENVP